MSSIQIDEHTSRIFPFKNPRPIDELVGEICQTSCGDFYYRKVTAAIGRRPSVDPSRGIELADMLNGITIEKNTRQKK